MEIQELKKELGISGQQIAEFFEYKNYISFRNSSAKNRIENALCKFSEVCRDHWQKENNKH